jgi:hypothetical protein
MPLADHVETTLPVARGTDIVSGGQVPSLGRLTIDEDQGVDQWWGIWGIRSENYSSAASAALYWEGEALTALSDSATAVGATGASGAGSNVLRQTNLTTNYIAMLSTRATGGGAHMSHVGTYRVFARLYRPTGNAGAVSVAWEWAEGDFRKRTTNATVAYAADEREGGFTLADLGYVSLSKVVAGTQRWEGRLLAKSTVAGDEIDCDYIFFVPVDEGAGQVSGVISIQNPTTWSARDEFDQTAAALTGKVLPVGGTWTVVTNSDADDFNVSGAGVVTRTAVSDTGTGSTELVGRGVTAGTTTYTNIVAAIDFKTSSVSSGVHQGLLVRVTDSAKFFAVVVVPTPSTNVAQVRPILGATTLQNVNTPVVLVNDTYYRVVVMVTANGQYAIYLSLQSAPLTYVAGGQHFDLATGGLEATGKVGIVDLATGPSAATRTYDNFQAWVPTADAACFASQSLAIYPDRAVREDSGGTLWPPVSKYEGAFARLPSTGREDRTLETIVKLCRNDPATGFDSGIDDLSFQWMQAPRGLTLPEPT